MKFLPAAAAGGALALAAALGAHAAALVTALVLWVLAWRPATGIARILLTLTAPVALGAGVPLEQVTSWDSLIALAAAFLGVVPLAGALGPGAPPVRVWLVVAGALAVPVAFAFTPSGAVVASSDLATGAAILALAAGLLIASAVADSVRALH